MKELEECIIKNNANYSRAREVVYRILLEHKGECLSVADIQKYLREDGDKRTAINTIYRHLNLFLKCNLTVMIQNDYKKAYYALADEKPLSFLVCRKCNRVVQYRHDTQHLVKELEKSDYITLHKRCEKCR